MRGDVHQLKNDRHARGHEQKGRRCAVVIQSDDLLALSTWIVAPTSTEAQPASFRPEVDIGGTRTRVLVEHASSVDPQKRLGEFVGRLTLAEMQAVDAALRAVLGVD